MPALDGDLQRRLEADPDFAAEVEFARLQILSGAKGAQGEIARLKLAAIRAAQRGEVDGG